MSLLQEYKKQYKWRDWETVYGLLPYFRGMTVLDLGCGPGDQAQILAARKVGVIAIDQNLEFIKEAQKKGDEGVTYHCCDLNKLSSLSLPQVDVLWITFTAAYFPNFSEQLKKWCFYLKPGGRVVLVEADDILGHSPMDERATQVVKKFYNHAFEKDNYDFKMGSKLASFAEASGLDIELSQTLPDKELCFNGPATSAILDAWKSRLNRLNSLQEMCGESYSQFRMRFMASLIDEGHRSLAKVHFVLARAPKGLSLC